MRHEQIWGSPSNKLLTVPDMNVRTLINIEKGRSIPSLLYAMKLANFLNIPVDQLFEYQGVDHALK